MGILKIAQVVGGASESLWSQALVLPTALAGKSIEVSEGAVLVALTLAGDDGEKLAERGSSLIQTIEATLIADSGGQPLSKILPPALANDLGLVDLVAVRFFTEKVEVVGYGGGMVVLQREGKVGVVFASEGEHWQSLIGTWQVGDRLLVGTKDLVGEMSKVLVSEVLGYESERQAGEELMTRVHAAEESSGAAGLVAYIYEEELGGAEDVEEVKQSSKLLPDGAEVVMGGKLSKNEQDDVVDSNKLPVEPNMDTGLTENSQSKQPLVYLKSTTKRRKTALSVGVVLLILLLFSVVLGWQRRQTMMWEERYETVIQEAGDLVDKAGRLSEEQPLEAKRFMDEALVLVDEALVEFEENETYAQQLEQYRSELNDIYAQVSGENIVSEVPVWYELTLMREGMFGTSMALSESLVVVLDGELGVVGQINGETKEADLVGGGELMANGQAIDTSGKRAVAYSQAGVVDLDMENKTSAILIEPDQSWQMVREVGIFSGNVYVLDAETDDLWRYPGLAQGVGEKQRWFGPGITPDLSGVRDMTIDGDIWLGFEDGQVKRYRRGAPERFEMSGTAPIEAVKALYTDENIDRVYVLDASNQRVAVFTKEGEYVEQYLWPGLSGVSDMVVDEELDNIYLLSGTSIYVMGLNSN